MKSDMNNFTLAMPSERDPIRPDMDRTRWFHSIQRSIGLSFLLLLLTTAGAYAQSFHWGLKAGADFMKVSGRSFDGKMQAGFSGGAFAELNLNSQWGLQPELLFNQVFTTTSAEYNQLFQGVSFQKVQLNYVTAPILIAFRPSPVITCLLGPQFGYLASQTTGLTYDGRDAFKKPDISIVFGGQLNLGSRVKFGLRYQIQVNNINNVGGEGDYWKASGLQTYLSYRIH